MKRIAKAVAAIIGGLVLLWLSAAAYFFVAPYLIGPKTEVVEFCSAIEPGTTLKELSALSDQTLQPIRGTTADGTVQVDLVLQNGWVCICQVETEAGSVLQPNDVFCSD